MSLDLPPLRSLLFVPGHRESWFEKGRASGADALILDLQDSVPESDLEAARRSVGQVISAWEREGPFLIVRLRSPAAEDLERDLDAIVGPGLGGVMVPAVTTAEQIELVARMLDTFERRRGLPTPSVAIVPLTETAKAVRFGYEIASASERVAYMGGASAPQGDIARAIGYRWSPGGEETFAFRSWVLVNMRAAGVPYPVSGLWTDIEDLDGLRAYATQSRNLGYHGLMVIHPSHVPVVNEVFTPSDEEVARWENVVRAMKEAQANGAGAIRIDGRMVDEADVKTAETLLRMVSRLRST